MAAPLFPQKSPAFQFITNREYFDELIVSLRATKRGDRVLLMSMLLEPTEPEIAVIMREMEHAASRGVRVSLAVDAHSFLVNAPTHMPGPLWARRSLPKNVPKIFRHKLRILESINNYPTGNADIINLPRSSVSVPIAGRSHIKTAIINDRIFLGGCNLGFTHFIDVMISWHDRQSADSLYQILLDIIGSKHSGRAMSWHDKNVSVTQNASIFIDSGRRGQSEIFKEALALIDSARDWLIITGQYFPNAVTAGHLLKAAKRGVKVEVIYSHPKHQGLIGGLGQQVSILRERTRLPKVLFENALSRNDPMLHAKLIASDAGVMIGSHNYVRAGVMLGTAEIALKSSDEKLAREAVKTLRRGLKKSKK
jgi:phosphatidylserine/phosphatidylglycerophosphate/cardiolipin synthase-like enzyme